MTAVVTLPALPAGEGQDRRTGQRSLADGSSLTLEMRAVNEVLKRLKAVSDVTRESLTCLSTFKLATVMGQVCRNLPRSLLWRRGVGQS